jgi:phosphoribosylformylglycinamidine cyclo-ligase
VVEAGAELGPDRVRAGDVVLGLASPGLRSNGYTLARHVLLERAGLAYSDPAWPGASTTVADELLLPSVIYTSAVRAAVAAAEVHAVAHITGGGFKGNIPRALPEGCRAVLVRGSWEIPPIFTEIRRLGMVEDEEMARVFNLGLGMVVAVSADTVDAALDAFAAADVDAVVAGWVEAGERGVELTGPPMWTHGVRS